MRSRHFILLFLLGLTALSLVGCTSRGGAPAATAPPDKSADPAAASRDQTYTVTYCLKDEVLGVETLGFGEIPAQIPERAGEASLVAWKNANGTKVDVWTTPVYADIVYDAVCGPALKTRGGFIAAEEDGLFHPMDKFTRGDAARAVYSLLDVKPAVSAEIKDMTSRARSYQAASALAAEGYMPLDASGRFFPDVAITVEDMTALLSRLFSPGVVRQTMTGEAEPITRARAAHIFNELLGWSGEGDNPYFPDVSPNMEEYAAVRLAGIQGSIPWANGQRPAPGFVNLKGYLYCVGQDGYFIRDAIVGTLYFDATGRYTSGDESVDKYVAELIESQTNASMSRDDMLRAVYRYVRDHYLYLKRSLYAVGETGWELKEALVMFQTGKGNCYNFTGAFWALARGLGYDAVCYSGRVGVDRNLHSWVEIEYDGVPYIFDVETEMSNLLVYDQTSMYKLSYEQGEFWTYAWEEYEDLLPGQESGDPAENAPAA